MMAYIVKSSLDFSGKVIPWNRTEENKLIEEKKEYLKNKETIVENEEKTQEVEATEEAVVEEATEEATEEEAKDEKTENVEAEVKKPINRRKKVGDK